MAKKLYGVFAVIVTPFTNDDKIDEEKLRRHVRYLIDEGKVHAIIPTGSTGEFAALSDDERMQVADIVISEADKAIPIIVGTAAVANKDTIRFSQYAQKAGADAVMVVPSYYCHPNAQEMYGHYKALAESIDIPIVLYNNPSTSGVDMLPELIARLAEFDNISYVKESSGDMTRVVEIMRLCGDKMTVFCGCDTLAMEMFAIGVQAWVAPPANFIPKQCVQLFELIAEKNDMEKGKQLYFKLLPLFAMFESTGQYIQLTKAAMQILGRPYGTPRKPLLSPDKQTLDKFKKILSDIIA